MAAGIFYRKEVPLEAVKELMLVIGIETNNSESINAHSKDLSR